MAQHLPNYLCAVGFGCGQNVWAAKPPCLAAKGAETHKCDHEGGWGVLLMGVVVNSFRKQLMPRLDTRASGRPGHSPWAYPNRWKVPGSQDRLDLHLLPTGLPASHWAPPSRPAGKPILPWPEGRVSVGRPEERAIWLSTSRSSGVRSLIRGIPWASNGSSS